MFILIYFNKEGVTYTHEKPLYVSMVWGYLFGLDSLHGLFEKIKKKKKKKEK